MVRELRKVVYSHKRMKQLLSFVSTKGKNMVPPIYTSCTLFSKPIWHSKTQTQGGDKGKEIKAGCPQHLPTFGSILILYKMKVAKRIISMSSFTLKCPRAEIIEGVLAEIFLSSVTLDHCAVCSCAIIKSSLCLEGYPPSQL